MKTRDMYSQPGHLIRRAYQFSTAAFMIEAKSSELTPVQFSALVAIRENPGIDATRVGELIYFDRATIGNVLERLEKRGLVTRKPGIHDRRTKHVFLTLRGQRAIRKAESAVSRIGDRILQGLSSSEKKLLLKLLSRVGEAEDRAVDAVK